ncbi:MAG: MFS transporter [Clostridia bacterium]|nr:MFS transporter [Clostridia bacterium]
MEEVKLENTEQLSLKKKKLEYKWIIVGLCFLMMFVGLGFCSGTKGLFLKPITQFLGIDRASYSISDSMRYIFTAVVNVFFGSLVARFGSKKLILAGCVSLFLSMVLAMVGESVFVFYLSGMFLGIGFSWMSTTMAGYIVNRWIDKNKGTVLGIVFCANGIGGAIAAQIVQPFISSAPDGYKTAYFVIASILVVLFVILLIFYKDKPIKENEDHTVKKKAKGQNWSGIEFSEILRKPYFYLTAVCVFVSGLMLQGITGVALAHMSDSGLGDDFIATVSSISMLALACSKFFTGFIYDKFGIRVAVSICTVFGILAMLTLTFLDGSGLGQVLAITYALFAAIALPLETIMIPIYSNELFGQKAYNKVLGIFVSVCTAGFALGAPILNMCFDAFGSYNPAFYVFASIMAVVVVLLQFVITSARKVKNQIEKENN